MMIPKAYLTAANAMLGVKDAISLSVAIRRFSPNGSKYAPVELKAKLKAKGLLAFVGNPPVTFIGEAAAQKAIGAFYSKTEETAEFSEEERSPSRNDIAAIRQDVEQLRKDLMLEIAKLRQSIEQLRGDVEALRSAQLAEKTAREKNHDALVEMLAEVQKQVAAR